MAQDWNISEKNKFIPNREGEKTVLVALITPQVGEAQAMEYLDELAFLAQTAGAVIYKKFIQKSNGIDPRTFIGSGKAREIQLYVEEHQIDSVIFDDDLSGKQTNTLESLMKCKILDRTSLILDIFATRAQTAQARTQVELAQMQYLLPRLRGLWTHLERQRGGIGMRGPGEKEIETDRRIVRDKISLLKQKLSKIDQQAQTQRQNRGELIRVALVGYTNVGKSTLMNLLGKAEVLAENKLFATLDTTVRKVVFDQMAFLLSDTVGFIRKLPTHLVESFKSTLDEVRESDLLLHVVDISHPLHEEQIKVVNQTLQSIGAGDKPMLYVFNKMDMYRKLHFDEFLTEEEKNNLELDTRLRYLEQFQQKAVFVSATDKIGVDVLKQTMHQLVASLYVERYPHQVKNFTSF